MENVCCVDPPSKLLGTLSSITDWCQILDVVTMIIFCAMSGPDISHMYNIIIVTNYRKRGLVSRTRLHSQFLCIKPYVLCVVLVTTSGIRPSNSMHLLQSISLLSVW